MTRPAWRPGVEGRFEPPSSRRQRAEPVCRPGCPPGEFQMSGGVGFLAEHLDVAEKDSEPVGGVVEDLSLAQPGVT